MDPSPMGKRKSPRPPPTSPLSNQCPNQTLPYWSKPLVQSLTKPWILERLMSIRLAKWVVQKCVGESHADLGNLWACEYIYIYINSLHGVAWQEVTTVGLVCIYAKFLKLYQHDVSAKVSLLNWDYIIWDRYANSMGFGTCIKTTKVWR